MRLSLRGSMLLAGLVLVPALPLAAQTCVLRPPSRLAERVAAARDFPRPLTAAQRSELSQLLPRLRSSASRNADALRAWAAKAGFAPAERCAAVYALVHAIGTQAVNVAAVSGSEPVAIQSQISDVSQQLAALKAELAALTEQLKQQSQVLKDLQAARPTAPGAQAPQDAQAAYQRTLAAWQTQVEATQQRIASLQADIAVKQREVDAKQRELDALQQSLLTGVIEGAVGGP